MENANNAQKKTYRISVKNFPKSFTIKDFKKLLSTLKITYTRLKIVQNKSLAFITFSHEDAMNYAIACLNDHEYKGRKLRAFEAAAKPEWKANECKSDLSRESIEKLLRDAITPLWNIEYGAQLGKKAEFAKSVVKSVYRKLRKKYHISYKYDEISKILNEIEQIIPSPVIVGYKNKLEFTIGKGMCGERNLIGFRVSKYKEGNVNVAYCESNMINPIMRQAVSCFQEYLSKSTFDFWNPVDESGVWTTLLLRCNPEGKLMSVLAFMQKNLSSSDFERLNEDLKNFATARNNTFDLCSLYLKIDDENEKLIHVFGERQLLVSLSGLKFAISPTSFFQTNFKATEILFDKLKDVLKNHSGSLLLDVCCGTGAIGLSMAKYVQKVIGCDMCSSSIQDANYNAELNCITNAVFYCKKAEDLIPVLLKDWTTFSDVIAIIDPPRGGIHSTVIEALRSCQVIRTVIYLSCNAKLASNNFVDLCKTTKNSEQKPFCLESSLGIDFFPDTAQVELMLIFSRQ